MKLIYKPTIEGIAQYNVHYTEKEFSWVECVAKDYYEFIRIPNEKIGDGPYYNTFKKAKKEFVKDLKARLKKMGNKTEFLVKQREDLDKQIETQLEVAETNYDQVEKALELTKDQEEPLIIKYKPKK